MLLDDLHQMLTVSLKGGDKVRVETIRFLLSDIRNAAIAKYGASAESSLTDDDVLAVIKKQVKTHRESIEAFQSAGRKDLVDRESAQLAILESYLPKEISDDTLKSLLAPLAAGGEENFGKLMGMAMARVKGQAGGARVSAVLKQLLNKK